MDVSEDDRDFDVESNVGRRAHHNALERKRRDCIKDSFKELRDSLPGIAGKKSSRVQILKTAAGYIQHMRRKNNESRKEIEDLLRQTSILEDAIQDLENGRIKRNSVYDNSKYDPAQDNMSFGSFVEPDSSDTDSSNCSSKGKLKLK